MGNMRKAIRQEIAARHPALGRVIYINGGAAVTQFLSPDCLGARNAGLIEPGASVLLPDCSLAGISGKTDIDFDATKTPNAIHATSTDLSAFQPQEKITVSGSTDNDGTYTVVYSTTNYIGVAESLTTEAAGDTIDIEAVQAWRTIESKPATASSTTVEVEPGFSAQPGDGTQGEIWNRELHGHQIVDKNIDLCLTRLCRRWVLTPLTMLSDGDMLKSGYADWTASGAILQKLVGAEGAPVGRYLEVGVGGDGVYAYQTALVHPSKSYFLAILGQLSAVALTSNSYGLYSTLYDEDNAAAISFSGDDHYQFGRDWKVLRRTFEAPSGCYRASVRLHGATILAGSNWAWVVLQEQNAREFPLPSRIRGEGDIGRWYIAPERVADPTESPGTWGLTEIDGVRVLPGRAASRLIARLPFEAGQNIIFFEEWQPYLQLTSDTSETEAEFDLVVEGAAMYCYESCYDNWRAGDVMRLPRPGSPIRDVNPWRLPRDEQREKVGALLASVGGDPQTIVER